ncbi:hypothetical protein RI129_011038 [Pyrocoelia pectoralis]|uniref:Uncharacterized protein n=1 Tax=Pyrocoelia pectoralis TaxID=417401 RepID=A0AAN7V389_9COLE
MCCSNIPNFTMSRILIVLLISIFFPTITLSYFTTVEATVEQLAETKHRLDDQTTKCIESTGADSVEVDLLWNKLIYTESRSLKCYLECMYIGQHYINDNGEFVSDNLVDAIANSTEYGVKECSDKVFGIMDGCDKVFSFSFCLMHTNNTAIIQLL